MSAPWLLDMIWRDVCFAHWHADAALLERTLPANVTLDRYKGEAWLSVVPFRMTGIRLRFAPTLPGFADVPEINLRTYVRVGGVSGIWFFSLDADSPLLVRAARITTGLPYYDARITTTEDTGVITYMSERTDRRREHSRFAARYRPGSVERAVEPDSLEAFLHERYHFFTSRAGRLVSGEVLHGPWSLSPLRLDITENSLGESIAHPLSGPPRHAYFARSLHVRAVPVQPVRF